MWWRLLALIHYETNSELDSPFQEVREKLNLSRFDNTILFTIPFTLFLVSALATWVPGFLSRLFNVGVELMFFFLFFVFVPLILSIISYVSTYFRDDVTGRMGALNGYLLCVLFAILLSSAYLANWLNSELRKFAYPNSYLEQLVTVYHFFALLLVGFFLMTLTLIDIFWSGIVSWCMENIPHKYNRFIRRNEEELFRL